MDELHGMRTMIGFACAALLLAGCQKEEPASDKTNVVANESGDRAIKLRTMVCGGCDQDGHDCDWCECGGVPSNCLPDVIVTRLHKPAVDEVITAIRSGDQSSIKTAFSANASVLAHYLIVSDIDAVITGDALATSEPGSHGERFIVISDLHDAVISAYPLYEEE